MSETKILRQNPNFLNCNLTTPVEKLIKKTYLILSCPHLFVIYFHIGILVIAVCSLYAEMICNYSQLVKSVFDCSLCGYRSELEHVLCSCSYRAPSRAWPTHRLLKDLLFFQLSLILSFTSGQCPLRSSAQINFTHCQQVEIALFSKTSKVTIVSKDSVILSDFLQSCWHILKQVFNNW